MTENVVTLPGVERRDIGPEVPSEDVLQGAIDAGVRDAIVIGRSRDGHFYIASASADVDATVGKLFRAATELASSFVYLDGEDE